jgi:tetratricopeptide (TPR) repeat protein
VGRFLEAQTDADDAVRIAEAVEHPASLTLAYWAVGLVHFARGDFSGAKRFLEHSLKILREANLPLLSHYVARSTGRAYAYSGRANEAILLLEGTAERDRSKNRMSHHALTLIAIAEANLLAGKLSEAKSQAEKALKLSCERKEPGHQAYALHVLGEIASRPERLEREAAEEAYRRSMALADGLGMQPLLSHCHLGLGKLYRQSGKIEESKEHLTVAAKMFHEMGMNSWLERAQKELDSL